MRINDIVDEVQENTLTRALVEAYSDYAQIFIELDTAYLDTGVNPSTGEPDTMFAGDVFALCRVMGQVKNDAYFAIDELLTFTTKLDVRPLAPAFNGPYNDRVYEPLAAVSERMFREVIPMVDEVREHPDATDQIVHIMESNDPMTALARACDKITAIGPATKTDAE